MSVPWRCATGSVVLAVLLAPRSSRDGIDGIGMGIDGPHVQARVHAVPEDGKANTGLEGLLADWLDLGKRSVSVTTGHTSRDKSVTLAGDPSTLVAALERRLAP